MQRQACAKIIKDKQELINQFMEQLSLKDSHYMKAMQKMSGDVEHLIECMMKQFESMRTDYSDQLKDIELRFESEREAILKANEKHIESLFAEHKKVEEDFLNKR